VNGARYYQGAAHWELGCGTEEDGEPIDPADLSLDDGAPIGADDARDLCGVDGRRTVGPVLCPEERDSGR
jgi:hypothetical protein